jgi:CubicO group peptidase (beta-lactamase class C family)
MRAKRLLTVCTVALAAIVAGAVAAGVPSTGPVPSATAVAPTSDTAAPAAPVTAHDLTEQDLHAYFDGLIPYALHRADMPGAVITVVKDGHILFAQGYGYADVKTKRPMIADRSLVRPGSVSKLFTWTSVMQLVAEHKLDLDRNINDYLDFKFPERFGKPITLRDCMTHSAGFEEVITDLTISDPKKLYPIDQYIKKHIPEEIFPPGKVVAYSNYATTVAGYIVQRVSGEPFDQYVADHIFAPLKMDHSTFEQPLPARLKPDMATGYGPSSEKVVPFENVEAAPAGALSTTATDMARFMMAHLNHGSYDGGTILDPATEAEMQTHNHTLAPGLNGFNLGFYDENRNGHRIIGHAGDLNGFHSDLHLITDEGIGLFMSFNGTGEAGAAEPVRVEIFRSFLDRYFPFTPPVEKTLPTAKADNAKVAGWYLASRRRESALRLFYAFTQSQVAINPDGTISIDALKDIAGNVKKWREVGPLLYREVGGQTHTKFVTDDTGNVSYWVSDDFLPVEEFQRVTGLGQMSWLRLFGGISMGVLLLTIVTWFGGWIVRRRFARPLALEPRERSLRLASRVGALLLLLLPLGWLGFVILLTADEALAFGGLTPKLLFGLYCLGLLALLGAVAVVFHSGLRVLRGPGGLLVRTGEAVLGLVALYLIYAVLFYGLVNFQTSI